MIIHEDIYDSYDDIIAMIIYIYIYIYTDIR